MNQCWFPVWVPQGARDLGRGCRAVCGQSFLTCVLVLRLAPSSVPGLPASFWAAVQRAACVSFLHVFSAQQGLPGGPGAGDPRNPFGRCPCPNRWHGPTKMSLALTRSESFSKVQVTLTGGSGPAAAAARARAEFTNPSACVSGAVNSDGRRPRPQTVLGIFNNF